MSYFRTFILELVSDFMKSESESTRLGGHPVLNWIYDISSFKSKLKGSGTGVLVD